MMNKTLRSTMPNAEKSREEGVGICIPTPVAEYTPPTTSTVITTLSPATLTKMVVYFQP